MKNLFWVLTALSIISCSKSNSDSKAETPPSPRRQPDLVLPADLKENYTSQHIVLPNQLLVPEKSIGITQVLGRVLETGKDHESSLRPSSPEAWKNYFQSQKVCLFGETSGQVFTLRHSKKEVVTARFDEDQFHPDHPNGIWPLSFEFLTDFLPLSFQKAALESLSIPEIQKAIASIQKKREERSFEADSYSMTAIRRQDFLGEPLIWNEACGERPSRQDRLLYSSGVSLGLHFRLIIRVSSDTIALLRTSELGNVAAAISNSQVPERKLEEFLVQSRARISLTVLQAGGNRDRVSRILDGSKCQIHRIQSCRNTIEELMDEFEQQASTEFSQEKNHFIPLNILFKETYLE